VILNVIDINLILSIVIFEIQIYNNSRLENDFKKINFMMLIVRTGNTVYTDNILMKFIYLYLLIKYQNIII
jgi:hypothetical protein